MSAEAITIAQMPRTLAGRYRLGKELGRGGMSVVYRSQDLQTNTAVAVKLLSIRLANDPVALLRFRREIRTVSSLHHDNICRFLDAGDHEGRMFLVMELLGGETLRTRLAKGSCDDDRTAAIAREIAEALRAAHSQFIVHRDIKPANIFLTDGGTVKLLDFGLAKHFAGVDPDSERTVTEPGHTAGTIDYMSPEQLRGERYDHRSDLFALGALLYEMLAGSPPFRAASAVETMARILHGEPPRIPPRPRGAEWTYLVTRLLAKMPDDRYEHAAAFLRDLTRLTDGVDYHSWTVGAGPPAAPPPPPSVAVLPFTAYVHRPPSLHLEGELQYFCHGLADEIVAALTRLKGLRVIPRTLASRAKSRLQNPARVGRQVHADRVLSGSVDALGDRLGVTMTLLDVEENRSLWSERYEGALEDLFVLRDQIVNGVVRELHLSTVPGAAHRAARQSNRRAFHLYLKGRYFSGRRYEGGLGTARQCFEEALKEDPTSALAHAGLADTYSFLAFYSLLRPRTAWEIATRALDEALRLDPTLPEAHASLGLIRLGALWDWEGAAEAFERAIDLDPSQTLPRIYLSWSRVLEGRIDEAHAAAEEAQDLDPLSPTLNAGAAYTFFLSRSYDRAIRECEKALEIDREFLVALYVMGSCYAKKGLYPEAIRQLEQAVTLSKNAPFYLGLLGKCYAENRQPEKATEILARLDEMKATVYVPPHCYVYIYAGLGELDRAFAHQDKAFEDGASPFNYFAPIVDALHDDPRFLEDVQAWRADA